MSFLINHNLSLIIYPKSFPFKVSNVIINDIIASEWQMLAVVNEVNQKESIAGISLNSSKANKICICGKDITQYCLIGNKYNGEILYVGFECLQKLFEDSEVFNDYKLAKRLIRKCKKCSNKFLITDMVGKCCDKCKDAKTSNYFGCISCLKYEKGIQGTNEQKEKQCSNCQVAKRPYYQIKRCTGEFDNIIEDSTELTYTGSGFISERSFNLHTDISQCEKELQCIQCNIPIILQEQLRAVPLDQIHKCVACVYPKHGRCVDCNKFMPEKIPGKDKCVACFKKLMRSIPKRECSVCHKLEIPNLPSNIDKTQCYSCWKKSK